MFYMWTQCCCDSKDKKKKKQPQATPNCFMVKLQAPPPSVFESLISDVLVIFLKAEPRFINF